ncbi:plasmid SOS inhibition protein A [Salmonella enterica]|nr:plasmid SOS inhibition protein A [Salmonella enterica]
MIPANLSLVPLSHERRAVMQAIAEVEAKYERGIGVAEFPYARTFFRILNGSKRVTVKDIGWFSPGLTAQSLRGNKQDWLAAIDRLIESRGACCWLPLSLSDGWRLFPETKFQMQERTRRHSELGAEKYTRQRRKEACQREMAYQALAGQAEIELAFHTPETVSSWSARWSERFPSLASMERWMMANQPFWSVMVESDALAKESPEPVRQLERWMVPNKLIHRSHA